MSLNLDKAIQLPEFSDDLAEEIATIGEEYSAGKIATEWAILRLCRLVVEQKFQGQEIADEVSGGRVAFTDSKQLIAYVCDRFNVSRASVYNRLDLYRNLLSKKGLGTTYQDALAVALNAPGSIKKIKDVVEFDDDGSIAAINAEKAPALKRFAPDPDQYVKQLNSAETEAERIELVRPLAKTAVNEAAAMENRLRAAQMLDETVAKNSTKYRHNGCQNLLVHCIERLVDMQTGEIIEREFDAEWQPVGTFPSWVADDLYSRTGALEEKCQEGKPIE